MNDLTEEKARRLPAGPDLDRICAEGIGCYLEIKSKSMQKWAKENLDDPEPYSRHWYWADGSHVAKRGRHLSEPDEIPFSSDWAFCGPLLEAMKNIKADGYSFTGAALEYCPHVLVDRVWRVGVITYDGLKTLVKAPTPQLAIARACAVLVAQGITVDDVNQPAP